MQQLMNKMDIYDAGMILRSLATGLGEPSSDEFVEDPIIYKVNLPYHKLETIINLCIDIDPRLRPTAKDVLNLFG